MCEKNFYTLQLLNFFVSAPFSFSNDGIIALHSRLSVPLLFLSSHQVVVFVRLVSVNALWSHLVFVCVHYHTFFHMLSVSF